MRSEIQKLLFIIAGLLVSLNASAYSFMVDGLAYDIKPDGKSVSVTFNVADEYGYPKPTYSGVIVIPEQVTYSGVTYSVTSIGGNTFRDCRGLTSITIPESITTIGEYAFRECTGLTSVTIPNSVISLEEGAFFICTGFTSVTIPNSVTSIGRQAFGACYGLTSVTIGNSVTSIGLGAFSGCESLTSVTIPNSVTTIGLHAFRSCKALTSITIPNSVTSIGNEAFGACSAMTNMVVESGNPKYDSRENCNAIIETATNTLVSGCKTTVIPNTVTSIGYGAFADCKDLGNVTIPNSIISIGERAYLYCIGLTNVTISNSVTSIGKDAFAKCVDLASVTIGNSVTSIENGAFAGCERLTSITIPNSVTSIEKYAFANCTRLTNITIPSSVTSIGQNAFKYCNLKSITIDDLNWWFKADNTLCLQGPGMIYLNEELIKHLIIPDGISTVRASAFSNCEGITGLTVTNSVEAINEQAFMGCSNLQNVIIGESVLNIGTQVFNGCPNIKEITCLGSSPATIYADTFQNYDATLFVPVGRLNNYKSAEHWLNFNRMTEGVSGVEGIESDGINVTINGGAIEVSGADGERVEVYSLSGQCVYSGMETSISVEKGIYIVRVAGEVHKVIL